MASGPRCGCATRSDAVTLIYLILPITFLIAAGFVGAFVWAARTGQFDDLATPPVRASFREHRPGKP